MFALHTNSSLYQFFYDLINGSSEILLLLFAGETKILCFIGNGEVNEITDHTFLNSIYQILAYQNGAYE
jgi:hypothetical protein